MTTAVPLTAAGDPFQGPASLTRLPEADVRALFSRNLIIRQGTPDHTQFADEFTTSGHYFQSGRRVPLGGSYTIQGDQVCVKESTGLVQKCHAFYRSSNGDLWWTMNFYGTETLIGIMLIQVEQNADTLKGM